MSRIRGTSRRLLLGLLLAPIFWSCQSPPKTDASLPSESSLLAVDVLFPAPLRRDPSLVQVFFVKGPIHAGLEELPKLAPATFVKRSRAYLLDPEPGAYALVAVSSALAPPWNEQPIAGVTQTIWGGTSADATIFPAEWIERTRTAVAPGRVAFMGALRVGQGGRLDANAAFQDALQPRIAERIRPGVTSESGLAGWLKRTRMPDLEKTSLSNDAGDLASFLDHALDDLGSSPWAGVVARAAARETAPALAQAPAPRSRVATREPEGERPPSAELPEARVEVPEAHGEATEAPVEVPEAHGEATEAPVEVPEAHLEATEAPVEEPQGPESAGPLPATRPPKPATGDPTVATRELEIVARKPEAAPSLPVRRRVPDLPPDSPLAKIEIGMSYHEVREILGPPDDRIDRTTAKAYIPFYNGPGAHLRDWIYEGEGRVVFSLYHGTLEVLDVIPAPHEAE